MPALSDSLEFDLSTPDRIRESAKKFYATYGNNNNEAVIKFALTLLLRARLTKVVDGLAPECRSITRAEAKRIASTTVPVFDPRNRSHVQILTQVMNRLPRLKPTRNGWEIDPVIDL